MRFSAYESDERGTSDDFDHAYAAAKRAYEEEIKVLKEQIKKLKKKLKK